MAETTVMKRSHLISGRKAPPEMGRDLQGTLAVLVYFSVLHSFPYFWRLPYSLLLVFKFHRMERAWTDQVCWIEEISNCC